MHCLSFAAGQFYFQQLHLQSTQYIYIWPSDDEYVISEKLVAKEVKVVIKNAPLHSQFYLVNGEKRLQITNSTQAKPGVYAVEVEVVSYYRKSTFKFFPAKKHLSLSHPMQWKVIIRNST